MISQIATSNSDRSNKKLIYSVESKGLHRSIYTRGFTFIEVMITMFLLLIVFAAFLPAFAVVFKGNQNNKIRTTSTELATRIIEEIKVMNYDSVGTIDGNPGGLIPQTQTRTVDGLNYTVETLISWADATGVTGISNIVAYKNVRVIVRAASGNYTINDRATEMNTIIAREGETSLVQAGHCRFAIIDTDNNPVHKPIYINLVKSGFNATMMIDDAGQAVFGVIPAGTYTATIDIPVGYKTTQEGQVSNGHFVLNNILVVDWQVTDVKVHMDEETNFCNLIIRLVDRATGNVITTTGDYSGSLEIDSTNYNFVTPSSGINLVDYVSTSKYWTTAKYNLVFKHLTGYDDFNMINSTSDVPKITGSETLWNGRFTQKGQTVSLDIPLYASGSAPTPTINPNASPTPSPTVTPLPTATPTPTPILTGQVSYLGSDTQTLGNWKSAYGYDGYILVDYAGGGTDVQSLPSYIASKTYENANTYVWSSSSTDPKVLERPEGGTKVSSCAYNSSNFYLTLNANDSSNHDLALYLYDPDANNQRSGTVQIYDLQTNTLIDTRNISNYTSSPLYLKYSVKGSIKIKFISTGWGNIVLEGVFWGGAATNVVTPTPSPTPSPTPTSAPAQVTYTGSDTQTQGSWKSAYGSEGYVLINYAENGTDLKSLPAYISSISYQNNSMHVWNSSTSDSKVLERPTGGTRTSSCAYNSSYFYITLNANNNDPHNLALYFYDPDQNNGRSGTIEIYDLATNALLDTRNISNYTSTPLYLKYTVRSSIKIKVICTGGCNVVQEGIFWGGAN